MALMIYDTDYSMLWHGFSLALNTVQRTENESLEEKPAVWKLFFIGLINF